MIISVTDKNALEFDKENKQHLVFAKYFSPGCPACIAMESEWNDMCKDIDKKYNTDLILADINPEGMSELENTDTYSDVDYVPNIVILENGKKISEYNGPKNKDDMINFLVTNGYLKNEMKGGSKRTKQKGKSKKNKSKKNKSKKNKSKKNKSKKSKFRKR
jgi:thiol-disulfide isomerase/thioredoxin